MHGQGRRKKGNGLTESARICQRPAIRHLAHKAHDGNLSTPPIRATETVQVRRAGPLLSLQLIGVHHERNGRIMVHIMARFTQPLQTPLCALQLARPDQKPRRFGRQQRGHKKRHGPHPLHGKGDAIPPLGGVGAQPLEHARRNELPNAPAQVDIRGQVAAQRQRRHLGRVGRARGGEDAPRDVAQELADEQHLDVGREEDHEHGGGEEDERAHEHLAVAVLGRQVAVEQGADDVADAADVVEPGLPGRRDLVAIGGVGVGAEFAAEGGVAPEIAEELCVVAFHDDSGGDH